MDTFFTRVMALPVLAAGVMAGASFPAIPADLTTPVQQRIAINGPNGELHLQSQPGYFHHTDVVITLQLFLLAGTHTNN